MAESKFVANIGPLTDDKDAFRQWDENMVNVLIHLMKGYGPAITCIKDLVDRGRGPEDTHRGMNKSQMSAVSSLTLADMVRAGARASSEDIDTEQLDSDLSFILVDKAKLKSEILNRIPNLKTQWGHQDVRVSVQMVNSHLRPGAHGPSGEADGPESSLEGGRCGRDHRAIGGKGESPREARRGVAAQ